MVSLHSFAVDKKYFGTLTPDEIKVLPILIEAAKKVDKLFLLQDNEHFLGGNFYPSHVSKEDIEEAAKKNEKILWPFTIVETDENGKFITVDFHEKYALLLSEISSLLEKAAQISKNESFRNYLKILANALTSGTYQEADIAWLAVKDSNIDVVIGPYERNLDKLFFIKRAYQGHVGIVDQENTSKARVMRDVLYTNVSQRAERRVTPPSIVDVQVQRSLIFSGFLGRTMFSEQHLPSDGDTTELYGSRIVGYLNSMDLKFDDMIYPIFNAAFEKNFKARYSEDILRKAHYYYVLLTSIARQFHRYRNSRERLKELFPIYDEANCVVSGINHAKHLVLKGVIDQKDLEAIMIIQICRIFSEWVISKKTNVREHYLKGDALTFNFLIREGALQEKDGISWPNFAKMFFEIENLSSIFTRFLEEETYIRAQEFLSKYLSFEFFRAFDKKLSAIKPI